MKNLAESCHRAFYPRRFLAQREADGRWRRCRQCRRHRPKGSLEEADPANVIHAVLSAGARPDMRSHVKQDGEKSVVLAEAGGLKQSERFAYGASSAAVTLGAERDIAGNTTYFSAQGGGKKLYEQKI